MDRWCASSCESTIQFFEYNTPAKKVGEHTAGFLHFANGGLLILPNSGIRFQMASGYYSYLDGVFREKKGILPDIQVPEGENALDWAVNDFTGKPQKR